MNVCAPCACLVGASGGWRRELNPLELELRKAISSHMDAGTQPMLSTRATTYSRFTLPTVNLLKSTTNAFQLNKWTTENDPNVVKQSEQNLWLCPCFVLKIHFIIFKFSSMCMCVWGMRTWVQVSLEARGIRYLGAGVLSLLMWALRTRREVLSKMTSSMHSRTTEPSLAPCALYY